MREFHRAEWGGVAGWLVSVAMNPFDALIQAMAAESMETLRHFDLSVALAAGMAPERARAWAAISRSAASLLSP